MLSHLCCIYYIIICPVESEAGVAKISRQDSVSSVPPATPSPVEKTAPPTIIRPDYAAGLGPLSSDTGSTLYGDQHISSSQPPPTTPSKTMHSGYWSLSFSLQFFLLLRYLSFLPIRGRLHRLQQHQYHNHHLLRPHQPNPPLLQLNYN